MLSQRQAESILVVVTFIAAFGWICTKESLQGLPVMGFLGIRFLAASILLFPLCIKRKNRLDAKQLSKGLIAGFLLLTNLLCWMYGVATATSLGEGAFIVSLAMLFVPLVSWLMIRIRPSRAFWRALPIALIGLALLSLININVHFEISHLFFLLSAIAQAFYFFYASIFAKAVPLVTFSAIQFFITGITSLILSLFFEQWPATIDSTTFSWLLTSILLATVLRFMLQMIGQRYASTENSSIIMVNEPAMVFIAGSLWYHTPVSISQVLGGALIIFSLLYYRLSSRNSNP